MREAHASPVLSRPGARACPAPRGRGGLRVVGRGEGGRKAKTWAGGKSAHRVCGGTAEDKELTLGEQETRQHAKCLRTTKDVRDYFRRYRQRKKGGGEGGVGNSGPQGSDTSHQSLSSGNGSETALPPASRPTRKEAQAKVDKVASKPAPVPKASKVKKSKGAKRPPAVPKAEPKQAPAAPLIAGGSLGELVSAPAVCSMPAAGMPTAGMPPSGFGDLDLGSSKLQPLYEFGSYPGLENNVVDQFLFPTALMPSFAEPPPAGPPMELPKVLEHEADASLVRESSRDLESSVTIVEAAASFLHQNTVLRGVGLDGLQTFPGDLFGV